MRKYGGHIAVSERSMVFSECLNRLTENRNTSTRHKCRIIKTSCIIGLLQMHRVTPWRHDVTHNKTYFNLTRRCARKMIRFCFYDTLVAEIQKLCQFCICMMTSLHDVMPWRQRHVCNSACRIDRKVITYARKMLFLCFDVITSWRLWRYKTHFLNQSMF